MRRAPLGLAIADGRLTRSDPWPHIARAYAWIDANTEHDAVVVSNPQRRMALSGNVPELPAMARRPLFVGSWFYLTGPFRDADEPTRREIAMRVVAGQPLDDAARAEFAALGRPLYVISYEANSANNLEAVYGHPVFRSVRVPLLRLRESGE